MRNFVQPGEKLTLTAPAAVASGDGVAVGSIFGVAEGDALSGEPVVVVVEGVFDLPKASADDIAEGAQVYWDATAGNVTTVVTGNTLIGVATQAAGAGVTTARVRLNGAF